MKKYITLILLVALGIFLNFFLVETFQINREKNTYMTVYRRVILNGWKGLTIEDNRFPYWAKIGKPYGIANYCGAGGVFFDTKEQESSQYVCIKTKKGAGVEKISELYHGLVECLREEDIEIPQKLHTAKTAAYLAHYIVSINLPFYIEGGGAMEKKKGIFSIKDWQEPFAEEHRAFARFIKNKGTEYPELKTDKVLDTWPGDIEKYIWFCALRAKNLDLIKDFGKCGSQRDMAMKTDIVLENASRAVRTVWMQAYKESQKDDK